MNFAKIPNFLESSFLERQVSNIEKPLKDTCEEAESLLQDLEGADDPAVIDQEGVANFKAQLCGESDGDEDEDELSLETMCYLFNYERFTQNGPGRVSAK